MRINHRLYRWKPCTLCVLRCDVGAISFEIKEYPGSGGHRYKSELTILKRYVPETMFSYVGSILDAKMQCYRWAATFYDELAKPCRVRWLDHGNGPILYYGPLIFQLIYSEMYDDYRIYGYVRPWNRFYETSHGPRTKVQREVHTLLAEIKLAAAEVLDPKTVHKQK